MSPRDYYPKIDGAYVQNSPPPPNNFKIKKSKKNYTYIFQFLKKTKKPQFYKKKHLKK